MRPREVWRVGALTALLFGCGPSTELVDVRRQTVEAAERYQSLLDAEVRQVTEAAAEATAASQVAAEARRRLDLAQNEDGAGGAIRSDTERQALRALDVAEGALERAIAAVDRKIEQSETSRREALAPWQDLHVRCVALEADEGESGGCGPIPPGVEPLITP